MTKPNDIPDEPKTESGQPSAPPGPEWRKKLLEAKAAGADDQTAAEYAELSDEEFDQRLTHDRKLEREMLGARAAALLAHLKSMNEASQWQAHEFMMEKLWPSLFRPGAEPIESARVQAIRVVTRTMSATELRDLPKILALGLERYKEFKAQQQASGHPDKQPCRPTIHPVKLNTPQSRIKSPRATQA